MFFFYFPSTFCVFFAQNVRPSKEKNGMHYFRYTVDNLFFLLQKKKHNICLLTP